GIFGPSYAQYQLAPLAPQLTEGLGLSVPDFTSIFSSPMIPAIFLSLVAGLLVDKFGIKQIIAIGLAATAFGTCWRIWSNSYITLFFSMLLTGVGAAFLNANGAKIIGSTFSPDKVGSMMGIFLAASTLGMTVGTGTTALLPGIQTAYAIAAVISVAVFVLWVLLIKNPVDHQTAELPQTKMLDSLKVVVKSCPVWIVGFCLMFILGCNVIISSFLPTALGQRGIDPVRSGAYAAVVTIGNLIGCLFAPGLVIKIGKIKPVMLVFALVSVGGAAFGWAAPAGVLLGACLLITGIAMGGLMPLLMSIPVQLSEIGPVYAGTAGGFTGTLQLLGAVIIPTYIAAPIAGNNMNLFFMLGGACMALVLVLVFVLPELGRKNAL
ncbi:MAG: MFS transporter, partial [Treponema sp.]|nr:MFS transporter [Treponema sp.]